jgi:hypothetical protein
MEARGRLFRLTPVTGLPLAERYSQIERLTDALWRVGQELGISMGPQPTLLMTGDSIAPPATLLARLSLLETEVLATFLMCGIGAAHSQALYQLAITGPGKPSPNFRQIIDDVYNDHSDDFDQAIGQD